METGLDGTTLEIRDDVLAQLYIVRDRFEDGSEGSARLQHNDGRSYNVHPFGNKAFRIVRATDGDHVVYMTLEYHPTESGNQSGLCTISSKTRHHWLLVLPSTRVLRAKVLSEQIMSKAAIDAVLLRIAIIRDLGHQSL
ncbi:uncharacterized protein MELLADRAFT_103483 [Melampsora larici-populina 98AG31]|uniref:Uncharacterized protein n=1 Tax=Melampsora larici-populina (strain 98AG31 / pathotype 3-4-7) TaxID=747676 RepID=F4RB18_MELLP|nr:uncharacterized protein MELLADRAFT_103483 [Melampsora larici-populina 98AG31]EGG10340.1 hypothetical protein MELLADRAFT_103483 [Melampsora larici-populina 98AG31]